MAEAMSNEAPLLNLTIPTARDIGHQRYPWSNSEIQSRLPTEVLLITVKDHEFRSCYSFMMQIKRSWCEDVGMVDFGHFGVRKVRVALIRSKKGPVSAALCVRNAATILRPKVTLFVGCCSAVNPAKARLGDVVISSALATYSIKNIREDGEQELHCIKVNVSRNMATLISYVRDGWNPPLKDHSQSEEVTVLESVVISGPEMIKNRARREELLKTYPDAIGLENEGEGLYAAAYDLGIEWAVIKGISDFADGIITAANEWRLFGSAMAASVVYHLFEHPDVIQQWPHYRRTEQKDAETEALGANLSPRENHGGTFSIKLNADFTKVVRDVCVTAVSLGALYAGYQLLRPLIEYAVESGFGGVRDDQEILGFNTNSLHVQLRCFTNERFLEVLADFETGRMKDRLVEEFSKEKIKIDGLTVEIENVEEVEKTKAAINKRLLQERADMKEISKDFKTQIHRQMAGIQEGDHTNSPTTHQNNPTEGNPSYFNNKMLCKKKKLEIANMDQNVFNKACNYLNIYRIQGNDWRGLAGKLEYTVREVQIFENSQNKSGPAAAMLKDWGAKEDHYVEDIVKKLSKMGRDDVAELFQQQLEMAEYSCNCVDCGHTD